MHCSASIAKPKIYSHKPKRDGPTESVPRLLREHNTKGKP